MRLMSLFRFDAVPGLLVLYSPTLNSVKINGMTINMKKRKTEIRTFLFYLSVK
jgi:hypothetical protein